MWIYKLISNKEFAVGYLEMNMGETGSYHTFIYTEAYPTKEEARKAVNYLNGGNPEIEINGSVGIIG